MITLTLTESHYQTVLNALRIAGDMCRDDARAEPDKTIREAFRQASQAYETVHQLIEEFAEEQA
jgi:polyhydroxyalkanoate synthesis regulator phasin